MRTRLLLSLLLVGALVLGAGVHFTGVLSKPRGFSSPETSIRLLDEHGSPLANIEVDRNWYDSDLRKDGSSTIYTDDRGLAHFERVPARVGLLTGLGTRALGFLSPCGAGGGTRTTIYVHYHGSCVVVPKDKILHAEGRSSRDQDGVWFYTSTDSRSNTLANLTFPEKMAPIDYVLSSKEQQ